MTVGITTPVAEYDPLRVALADPAVGTRLLAAARALLGPRGYAQEADDVVQDARTRALERSRKYDPSRDVVCWLVGFVVNVAREHIKKCGRAATGPALDHLADDLGRTVEEVVADREFVARLLVRLTPDEQEMVRLVYTEKLSFTEIGERLGLSAVAARVRHFRLIGHLRELAGEVKP